MALKHNLKTMAIRGGTPILEVLSGTGTVSNLVLNMTNMDETLPTSTVAVSL